AARASSGGDRTALVLLAQPRPRSAHKGRERARPRQRRILGRRGRRRGRAAARRGHEDQPVPEAISMSEPLNLGDSAIGAATAAGGEVITQGANGAAYLTGLGDRLSATCSINFAYGSGGTTLKVIIETSLDQGVTWIEVYRAAFTTASGQRVVNISALTPVTA